MAITLCYADWQTLTSQMQLGAPTDDAAMLAAGAATLIQRHWQRTRAVRLIGVRAGRLTGANRPAQLTLSYERPPERLAADEGGSDPRDSP